MQINIRYGIETVTKTVEAGTTIGQLKADVNLRAVLGYGDNSKALINGVEMTNDVVVPAGGTVVFETACNTKAV
jgi:hypothetical protein